MMLGKSMCGQILIYDNIIMNTLTLFTSLFFLEVCRVIALLAEHKMHADHTIASNKACITLLCRIIQLSDDIAASKSSVLCARILQRIARSMRDDDFKSLLESDAGDCIRAGLLMSVRKTSWEFSFEVASLQTFQTKILKQVCC